jgi:hypothetical protein
METMTEKMHTVAVKTEQETVSMHVITIFTLVFLPGTFLAVSLGGPYVVALPSAALTYCKQTFFSSGVFQWDEDGHLGSEWVVRQQGIKLFLSICLPMMGIVLATWAVIYWFTRRRRDARERAAAAAVSDGYADEKAILSTTQIRSITAMDDLGIVQGGQELQM